MLKSKLFWLFLSYFILLIITFVVINLLLKDYTYLYLINIILGFIFSIICFTLIYFFYIVPILASNNLAKNYNEANYAYKNYNFNNPDLIKLNANITSLANKLNIITQKYQEISTENQNYYEQYQKDIETKKQLVASISHEIKTPLAVIEATASALYDDIFPKEDEKKELNNIINECDKTSQMLQEIVNIYKLDSKNVKLDAKEYNIKELILTVINEYNNLIIKYKKTINILNDLSFIYKINYNQFKKALENIILNAIIYSPLNEEITISLNKKTNYYALEIINYGVNIPKEAINKLFEPFYRVDEARTKKEDHGNGLGLYIVKEILDKHQLNYGIINIDNGVKFYILFPMPSLN